PGEIVGASKSGIYVQCGEGVIEILEMQKAGGKRLPATQCISMSNDGHLKMQFQKRID
ncbi:MAG: hypothetical protein B7Z19_02805, partial [Polynucleobacter sp. 32-46-5]